MARSVQIPITAKDKTAAAFNSAKKGLGSLGNSAAKTAATVAKIGVAFGTAGVAAAAAMTKSSMASIDSLAKTADKIGTTTEALTGLRHAAELTGVGSDTLDMAMQRLTRRVSEAANGTGEAKNALIELGINAENLEKLPLDKQMEVIADQMGNVKSQSDKVRLAMKLFDSEGVALVNTLSGGSEGLQAMAKEADHLGITMSRVDAAQIEVANDAVTRAKGVFTGLGNQLAQAFAPIVMEVADAFRQTALDSEGFGDIGQRVADIIVKAFGFVADTVYNLRLGFLSVKRATIEIAQVIVDKLNPSFKEFAQLYNRFAAIFGKEQIDTKFLDKLSSDLGQTIIDTNDQIKELLTKGLPSAAVDEFYENVKAKNREAAESIAQNSPAKVITDQMTEAANEATKKMTFMQEQQMKGEEEKKKFMMMSTTAQTSHVLGELNNQFSGIAANNKKLFALNKAFQIAQAVMQTYQGATLALSSYPPPLSFIMAGAQVAAGLGQVAQIRAQSFEGGGFTGRGSRSGGMDGKGGFPAMLHPNESVIDHTKGQAGGITIINNVDASGADANVDMKIRAAMQQTSQQTVATIQDLMRRRRFV